MLAMTSLKLLFLILLIIQTFFLTASQLNGKCGYPGKPYRAKLEPDNKLQYDEGEEVTYQCTDFWSFVQTRKCERGKWTGVQPRCGDFVDRILMKDSKLEDITNPDKPIKVFEHKNMNITNTTWRYPNTFTSNRFKTARLKVVDNHRYKWSFRFTAPTVMLFVRINFNFINYTLLTAEEKQNFTLNIAMFVSPHRKCQLIHQSDDKWRQSGRKIDNDFLCDTTSLDGFRKDMANPGDYMVMETQTNIDIVHELIAVFLGKSYGTEEDPFCGEPEISIGQSSRFNVQHKDYIIDCKPDKFNYISASNDIIPETSIHGVKCGPDMKWNGSYPDCIPKKQCHFNNLLTGTHSNHTVIVGFDGLYFFNETQYYAIEGTEVDYGCNNPSSDILVGKEKRSCLKTGLWGGSEPYCYDPEESAKFPVWLLIGSLFFALIFILSLTAILFYVYTKRIKNRITKQITNQTRPESERYDGYDDIEFPVEGKQLYSDTYETVGAEVRYADPYYTTDNDYVRMPSDVQIQSGTDYWRIPTGEADYLEMTHANSAKTSPRPSPRKSPKAEETYVYEF